MVNVDVLKEILKELNERISVLEGKSEAGRIGEQHPVEVNNIIEESKKKNNGLNDKIDHI